MAPYDILRPPPKKFSALQHTVDLSTIRILSRFFNRTNFPTWTTPRNLGEQVEALETMTPFHLSSAILLALCFLLNSETTLNRVLQHKSSLNPWNIGVLCFRPWVTTVPKCITPGSRIGLMFLFPTGKAFYAELHHSRLKVSFCIVLRSHMLYFSLVFFFFPSCLSWLFLY
jgi:hypothetical protein